MDTFDVNLLSQVQALSTKLSISQEHLHLKKKAHSEERGKGRHHEERTSAKGMETRKEKQTDLPDKDSMSENVIDITV
ncbi:hypothetical protein [Syntrophorhabdus aromaticivorans]|uniref:Uncharacterized protein n=1 Tax=Syntrophorhabdus aromaticivorans TaxID=328301 RepID=A0A351U7X7_9BACT|nr:hypothetical protein [Syntrophorhabdus aromaticivorans]NLW35646.1 hypothetical protein [Syntrophorhabdus aromaticivorans]HBA56058.1 hypothetical protein [Syntrophorhabdus aromaticivorans]